jgi:predicted NBD/HSP70 family sugar kinase
VDFTGARRHRWRLDYRHADPDEVLSEIAQRLKDVRRKLSPEQRERVQGIGIAAPLSMGGWQQLLGLPARIAEKWQRVDLAAEVSARTQLPVTLVKDSAAACVAELVAGRGRSIKSFLYVFVYTFIGGGLVLDGHLRPGSTGNAGAIGTLPLWLARGERDNAPAQLLSVASLFNLEQLYGAAGLDLARGGRRARADGAVARAHVALAGRGGRRDRAGRQLLGLPARPRGRGARRLVRRGAQGRADRCSDDSARTLQLGRCVATDHRGRHHRF